ncbi:MAG: hypothetical protein ACREFY_11880 [Acetobacteraceae bacterium]
MRIVRLARIAAEAEGLALRRRARAAAGRAVRAALAAPFLLVGLGFFEAAFWLFLAARLPDWGAALVAGGANLLVGLLLMLPVLRRPRADPVAREAARIRRQAVAGIEDRLRLGSVLVEVIRAGATLRRRGPPS